jgi:hypothetical protein
MHPPAQVDVLHCEEVPLIEEPYPVQRRAVEQHRRAGEPVHVGGARVVEVRHQVARGEPVAGQETRQQRIAVEERRAEVGEAPAGELQRAVRIEQARAEHAGLGMSAQVSDHRRRRPRRQCRVWVEDQDRLRPGRPDAGIDARGKATVAVAPQQTHTREPGDRPLDAALWRGIVDHDRLVRQPLAARR